MRYLMNELKVYLNIKRQICSQIGLILGVVVGIGQTALLAGDGNSRLPNGTKLNQDEFKVLVLGDSISSGFNSDKRLLNNKDVAWFGGSRGGFDSHYNRIKKLKPETLVRSYNNSIPGITAQQLDFEARNSMKLKADYVGITVGANDLCRSPTKESFNLKAFKYYVDRALRTLIYANANVKIVMSYVPDVIQLRRELYAVPHCKAIYEKLANLFCAPVLHPDLTEADLDIFSAKRQVVNQTIKEFSKTYQGNVVPLDPAIADMAFKVEHVSMYDCFHPSMKGQELLSNMTWVPGLF